MRRFARELRRDLSTKPREILLADGRGIGSARVMHVPKTVHRQLRADLESSESLRGLLVAVTRGVRERRVVVALRCAQRTIVAGVTDDGDDRAHNWVWPLGCLGKLLVGTLARAAATEGQLDLDSPAEELLADGASRLRGVTLRHLLEHTHGLDDSMLAPPRYWQGFIDRAELVARVGCLHRWSESGALYSYGNLGAWLVAAVLERVYGRAYGLLVRDRLLAPGGVRGTFRSDRPLCAATGAGLALTAEQLVRFVAQALPAHAFARPVDSDSACSITQLPGWNPLERGIYLGWKYAGGGWFGHQSTWPQASAYVRVHPWRNIALAVLSQKQAAAIIAVRLFGSRFPELFDLKATRREAGAATSIEPKHVGRYQRAAHAVDIAATGHVVRVIGYRRDAHGSLRDESHAILRAAGDVWFAQPATELVPYVQFLASDTAGELLWNGRCVWQRSDG